MRRRFILIAIGLELVIIIFVSFRIYSGNNRGVLSADVSINPVDKNALVLNEINGLEYFFEPKPNSQQTADLGFMGEYKYKVVYKINSDGLNQLSNYNEEKPGGVFRIVALGDSFTFGQYVNTEDNYPSQLESLLNKSCKNKEYQVVNLGVGGYDIRYAVERYKLRGQKYDPDLILWLIIDDDLKRINELLLPRTYRYDKEIREAGEFHIEVAKQKTYYPAWVKAREEIINELGGEENVLNLQSQYLKELNQYFKGPLTLFTFSFTETKYKKVLEEFIKSRPNSFFYDGISNIFTEPSNYLPDYGHPSVKGYVEIVNSLFNYLTKNKIIPCD